MSWFSELTSKAEAMLVKLDQDAAQALQNPDSAFRSNKIIDQALSSISTSLDADTEELIGENQESPSSSRNSFHNLDANNQMQDYAPQSIDTPVIPNNTSGSSKDIPPQSYPSTNSNGSQTNSTNEPTPSTSLPMANQESENRRAFKIQTSKMSSSIGNKRANQTTKQKNNKLDLSQQPHSSNNATSQINLGADDIKASITRSLQEYSTTRSSKKEASQNLTSYSSHYDSQPNLIDQSPIDISYDRNSPAHRKNSAHSFSIDLPESPTDSHSRDFATRLLKQGAIKNKSTFNLHKVINRLVNQSGGSSTIFSDQMKIRLRRTQLRASRYARRLNYYFRAYPQMKYIALCYVVVMQLLVVYVLFFYQSSSSAIDISTKIENQPSLAEQQFH